MGIVISRAFIGAILLAAGPSIAQAQQFNSIGGNAPPKVTPKEIPPPALPGAAGNTSPVVPSVRPANDMEPTDALFDAINRGDIGSARDAISRGADLHGHNILGLTPMELSVDLGRNDISFLLLSMRGADDGRNQQPPATTTAAKPVSAKAAKQAARTQGTPAKTATATATKAPAAQQTARLFSGDGGAPIPNAGFLGFDAGRH
ncbi:MAG TPA: ankyrin repeat domain-containing protein [Acetobacteraceae bacterium]|jgi:hypothetical protein|nr:ankyrin repeat domain-containing protein [Acetobacteraceae bacterium]